MDYVTCQLALGGDQNNTIPKGPISVIEMELLRAIHGPESVQEITLVDCPYRKGAEPNERAIVAYLKGAGDTDQPPPYQARDDNGVRIVDKLYPGAHPSVPRTLDELNLPTAFLSELERDRRKREAPAASPQGKRKAAKLVAPVVPTDDDELAEDPEGDTELVG